MTKKTGIVVFAFLCIIGMVLLINYIIYERKRFIASIAYSNVRILHSYLCSYLEDTKILNTPPSMPSRIVWKTDKELRFPLHGGNTFRCPIDEWGNEYRMSVFAYMNIVYVSVRSGGEDKIYYNDDDIFYTTVECTDTGYFYSLRSIADIEKMLLHSVQQKAMEHGDHQ